MTIKSYKTQKGTRFMFTTHLGMDPITGKRVMVTRRGFTSRRAAQSAKAELQYAYDNGLMDRHADVTYKDVYDRWVKLYAKTVKSSTLNKTLQYFRIHILPTFGALKLDAITPLLCQDFADKMAEHFTDLSKVYSSACRVYDYARKLDLASGDNPFDKVIKPKPTKHRKVTPYMTREELSTLLNAIAHPMWHVYFYLLAHTGARRGEALAVRWQDIDLAGATWHICRTITVGVGNVQYYSTPKTYTSDRTIDLDPDLVQVLRDYRGKQKVQSVEGLIFCTAKGGMLSVTKPYAYLNRTIRRNGLKHVSPHSFRHTHCSMLFEAGWTIKDVQERLGHRDMQTTMNIYLHVTADRKRKSMEQFVEYLKEG